MKLFVPNVSWTLRLCLTTLRLGGFWWPKKKGENWKTFFNVLTTLSMIYLVGIYIMIQIAELISGFGDVSRMSRVGFLLFTNLVLTVKMINVVVRREQIRDVVDAMDVKLREVEGDEEVAVIRSMNKLTKFHLYIFTLMSMNTVGGLAFSARRPNLPLPARYPFDSTTYPGYELCYTHQVSAISIAAIMNISLDTLVTSLIAQCCCRFKLLTLALKKLCNGFSVNKKAMLSEEDEKIALNRLRDCIEEHQEILRWAAQIQKCFSLPTFFQLSISSFIICFTAYQLAFEEMKFFRLFSMIAYLLSMTIQVFLYCYYGNELSLESNNISGAAYECSWYKCSPRFKRSLIILMIRSVRVVYIKAGGLTILSLATFMRIIKASYSFFTVLQSVQE